MKFVLEEAFAAPASAPDWQAQLLKALGCREAASDVPQRIELRDGPYQASLYFERPTRG